jgi:hypothetical protein
MIGGYQTVLIENCTYVLQEGKVVVEDSAILILRNAQLVFNESYKWPGEYLLARDNARLSVENVTMDSNFGVYARVGNSATANIDRLASLYNLGLEIALSDEAGLSISNSILPMLWLFGGAKASVSGSSIFCTSLYFDRYSTVEVIDMHPGFCRYWELWENKTISGVSHPSFQLTIENTTIENWSLEIAVTANIKMQNSTLALILDINENLQINAMQVGYTANWSLNLIRLQTVLSTA